MGTKNINGFSLTYDADWTKKLESREHWQFYWQQAAIIEEVAAEMDNLVEIGVGSGFLQNYLRSRGRPICSVDIDEEKNADYTADVSSFDFCTLKPTGVLAFEVFEHIPFPLFRQTIENIIKAQPEYIIFSLPLSVRTGFLLNLKLPKVKGARIHLKIPKSRVKTKNHHWELNVFPVTYTGVMEGDKKGLVSRNSVRAVFEEQGYGVREMAAEGNIRFFMAKPDRIEINRGR